MSDSDAAAHLHHTIDYIEITVTDLSEAKRFYGAAFGWAFSGWSGSCRRSARPVPGDGGGRRRLHRHTGLDTERPADPNSKQEQDDPTPRH